MKKGTIIILVIVAILVIFVSSFVSRYNGMVKAKVEVENQWSQVENQYQRRFDLIPNLVETVKGYAAHESETLIAVTEARSKVGGVVNAGNVISDPKAFAKFQEMQASLSGALQRLMVVVEKYPDLKANQNFLALQSQLEGTENRISVARRDFNEASKLYNQMIVTFPNNILAGMFNLTKLEFFQATTGAEEAPKVQF
jgi:LemA protein